MEDGGRVENLEFYLVIRQGLLSKLEFQASTAMSPINLMERLEEDTYLMPESDFKDSTLSPRAGKAENSRMTSMEFWEEW